MLLEHDLLRLFAAVVEQLQKLGLIPTLRRLWMDMSSDKNSKSSSASPAELWGHMIHACASKVDPLPRPQRLVWWRRHLPATWRRLCTDASSGRPRR